MRASKLGEFIEIGKCKAGEFIEKYKAGEYSPQSSWGGDTKKDAWEVMWSKTFICFFQGVTQSLY